MTALDHDFLNEVRAATGFQDIELRGTGSIVNPLTGRIYDLRTPGRRKRYLQSVSLKVNRARKLQAGIDGYSFRKVRTQASTGLAVWEYRLPYHIPVARATLDLPQMLAEFAAHANVPANALIRLKGQLCETDRYVSEVMMTVDQLENLSRPLFTGPNGTAYANLEDLKLLQISVYSDDVGASCSGPHEVPLALRGKTQAIAYIYNDNNLCAHMCLVYSMATIKQRENMTQRPGTWTARATTLAEEIGDGPMSKLDFKRFTDLYTDWGIVCFAGLDAVKWTLEKERPKLVYLLWTPGHYHCVRNPDKLTPANKFCVNCLRFTPRQSFKTHKCVGLEHQCYHCKVRFASKPELDAHKQQDTGILCEKCNCTSHGPQCAEDHACTGRYRQCDMCNTVYDTRIEEHTCFTYRCECCRQFVKSGHRCFIQQAPKPRDKNTLIAFDFESDTVTLTDQNDVYTDVPTQNMINRKARGRTVNVTVENSVPVSVTVAQRGEGYQVHDVLKVKKEDITGAFVDLIVTVAGDGGLTFEPPGDHKVCAVSWETVGETDSNQYMHGWDTLERFVTMVLQTKNATTWVAHNGRSYDFPLLKAELEKQNGGPGSLEETPVGTKLFRLKPKRHQILFLDSCNHIQAPLKKFPKIFGLPIHLRKGTSRIYSRLPRT